MVRDRTTTGCLEGQHATHDAESSRRIVARSDPVLGPRPTSGGAEVWDRLAELVNHADEIVAMASRLDPLASRANPPEDQERWHRVVETADRVFAAERPVPVVDRSLGQSLGW